MESITLLVVVWGLSAFTLTTGVGPGAVYSPLFVFVSGLDIPSAVATSVVVQLAGVGTTALSRRRTLNTDPGLVFRLSGIAAVGVAMMSLIGSRVSAVVSEIVFVGGMLSIGVAIPAAVLGSMTARFGARHVSDDTLRVAIGLLVIVGAVGVAVREFVA